MRRCWKGRWSGRHPDEFGGLLDVFVAAAREVHDDDLIGAHGGGRLDRVGDRVGGFECGDDALDLGEVLESIDGFFIRGVRVFGATGVPEVGVLGSDGGIIEAGGDGVGIEYLAVLVLQDKGAGALENAEAATVEAGRVFAGSEAPATGLYADEADGGVIEKGGEYSDGVAPATDARGDEVGQAAFLFEDLAASLDANDAVKVAHHGWVGMGAVGRAKDVVGVPDIGDPVSHGLVDGLLEGALAGEDGNDLGAEEAHACDVEGLAFHVDFAHVDGAIEAELGGDGGGGYAVLAGAGFRDHAAFAHAAGEEGLAQGIIDLMGAGVEQVLAFQVDTGTLEFAREALGEIKGRWSARVVPHKVGQFLLERRVDFGAGIFGREITQGGHERLRDEHAPVRAEVSPGVGERGSNCRRHRQSVAQIRRICIGEFKRFSNAGCGSVFELDPGISLDARDSI